MPTNQYFSSSFRATTKDQVLKENLIIEAIKIYGIDVDYLPRTFVNFDSLFGEDSSATFDSAFPIEMYIKSVDGFGGDGHFLSKFGLEIRDEIILEVSIKRFKEDVVANVPEILRPREGDIIRLPVEVDNRERLYEISYVDEDYINHQLGAVQTYEIRCKVYEHAGETFDTGDVEIDAYEIENDITLNIALGTGSGTFVAGEAVTQPTSGFTANVVAQEGNVLILHNTVGEVDLLEMLDGSTSGASYALDSIVTEVGQANLEDNTYLKDYDDEIVDFTVKNPFSE